jgi:hypothetical protein
MVAPQRPVIDGFMGASRSFEYNEILFALNDKRHRSQSRVNLAIKCRGFLNRRQNRGADAVEDGAGRTERLGSARRLGRSA